MRPCACRPHLRCGGSRCDVRAFLKTLPPPAATPTKADAIRLLKAFYETPAPNSPVGASCKGCAAFILEEIEGFLETPQGSCNPESAHVSHV